MSGIEDTREPPGEYECSECGEDVDNDGELCRYCVRDREDFQNDQDLVYNDDW